MTKSLYAKLYETLEAQGYIEFGARVPGDLVRGLLNITYPESAPKKVYDSLALQELAAIDYIRNILLGKGMYLTGDGPDYRILTPAENVNQVENYMASSDKKLRRALKLSRNTPRCESFKPDQTQARIVMKRETIKQARESATLLANV